MRDHDPTGVIGRGILALLSDALKKDEERPMQLPGVDDASETGKPQQDSSPRGGPTCQNHPPKKCLTLVFWCPKERWSRKQTMQNHVVDGDGMEASVAASAFLKPKRCSFGGSVGVFWSPRGTQCGDRHASLTSLARSHWNEGVGGY